MITGHKKISKWASERPESPEPPVSPVPTSKHIVAAQEITPPPLSGKQVFQPLSDLPETPVSRVRPAPSW
jgi:hypothetical protein